jgi:hypothetical protein
MMSLPILVRGQREASPASEFVDSVGVVTHFGYTDTNYYKQPAQTIAAIQRLGVSHVRDGIAAGWVAPQLYSIYSEVAAAGIHPEMLLPNPGKGGPSAGEIEKLLAHYPGADAVEAPNEYDQTHDADWAKDLRRYLPTVLQVGRDLQLPVIGPSLTKPESYPRLGDVGRYMDFGNIHAYWGGRNPETDGWGPPDSRGARYGAFAYDLDEVHTTGPGRPVMMTETGYVVSNTPKRNEIPEAVEAIYEPRLVLHAWNEGVRRTYIYELMDDPSSTPGFGLLHADLTPRPAYRALAALLHLLADSPGPEKTGRLSYTLSHADGLETTLLEKHDGSFWLAIWNSGCIYEVNELHSIPVATRDVTLTLTGKRQVAAIWTFEESGDATKLAEDRGSVSLQIGSAVTLIEIR